MPGLTRSGARRRTPFARLALALSGLLLGASAAVAAPAQGFRDRLPEDEFIYFVLPDRFENGDPRNDTGGIRGGRLVHGFDPTHKGFYNGGDLAGLTRRLDYLQGMGVTAIWLGPIYQNNPVQGPPGQESAGYHGYWITNFLNVDPHFGTRDDMRRFVDAAHARGMKVYLDIITNHTADIIQFREGPGPWPYRSHADFPYSTRGGPEGAAINEGFAGLGAGRLTAENFARLTRPDYAYTPYVPEHLRNVKVPAWLNDPIYYHNRGETTFQGESSLFGDFAGLDDLFTEHPRVVQGMIDIFGQWIDDFGIDGFRIDTARHVNPEFWQAFVPAMMERACARGIPNFHIFGEVFDPDPGSLATFTRIDGFPSVLDFAFQSAVTEVVAGNEATSRLARLFRADTLYEGGAATALRLPTFLGNHDMGRFARFVRERNPEAGDDEILARVTLGHAMMMFSRGVPTIYYGDEQGFAGDPGGDQNARESMFPSRVAVYNDNRLVGTNATTAQSNFDTGHVLYRAIAGMARIRASDAALRRGEQRVLNSVETPGLFAIARVAPDGSGQTIVAFNTGATPLSANLWIDPELRRFETVHGNCAPRAAAPGSYPVSIPAFGYVVCRSQGGAR